MKLFCISPESSITSLIAETAKIENWQFCVLTERTPVTETVTEFNPDLILVDVATLADLQWWNEQGLSDRRAVIFLNSEITEEFLTRAFEIGADGLLPKKWLSPRSLKARVN